MPETTGSRVTQWGLMAACLGLTVCLQVGCATVHTRFCRHPSEIDSVFPATRVVAKITFETYEHTPLENVEVSDQGSAGLIGAMFLAYPLVEFPPAIVTDVLLLPMDYYFVSSKSSDGRRAREQLLDDSENKRSSKQKN